MKRVSKCRFKTVWIPAELALKIMELRGFMAFVGLRLHDGSAAVLWDTAKSNYVSGKLRYE